jgi:hypothetical protein
MLATQKHAFTLHMETGSLLALMFNRTWCAALNQRRSRQLTHFAMHHADVEAPPGWLDLLVEEQQRVHADVLSVVVPIKDNRGLTSTGWQDPETRVIRRFTMSEIAKLPPTFSAEQVAACGLAPATAKPQADVGGMLSRPELQQRGQAGRRRESMAPGESMAPATLPNAVDLVVNTGLWICDFTRPWVEEVCFSIVDAVCRNEQGEFEAKCLPEDWNFSGWCAREGLRVFATSKVAVTHHGRAGYRNDHPWGEWQTDRGDKAA